MESLPSWMHTFSHEPVACAAALAHERGRFTSWSRTATPTESTHNVLDSLFQLKRFPHVAYLANQKVASRSMLAAINAVGGFWDLKLPYYSARNASATPGLCEKYQLSFVFTLIREPLACSWSGYTEVTHRNPHLQEGECDSGDRRYATYLKALKDGHRLARPAYHSWPQALKLDVRIPDRCGSNGSDRTFRSPIHFVGRLENSREVLPRLASHPAFGLDANEQHAFAKKFFSNQTGQHFHDTICDKQVMASHSYHGISNVTLPLLCGVYRIDYLCLGYPEPELCRSLRLDLAGPDRNTSAGTSTGLDRNTSARTSTGTHW